MQIDNNYYGGIVDKAEGLIADAATYGAQLVVFPEALVVQQRTKKISENIMQQP